MRRFRMHHRSSRFLAYVASASFLLATNYCLCEVFAGGSSHAEASHQHAPSGHHEDGAPSSDAQDDPCCSTLQAIVTPQAPVRLSGASQSFFHDVALLVVNGVTFADLSLAPHGLSPPARAPTPSRPIYHTTFASHAPPVCLALD